MRNDTRTLVVAVAATALLATARPAQAERWGSYGRLESDLVSLAAFPLMRKPLDLSDKQFRDLMDIQKARASAAQLEFAQAGLGRGSLLPILYEESDELSDEDRRRRLREVEGRLLEISRKHNEKSVPMVRDALTPQQFQRLKQIAWQRGGHYALTDPEVVSTLDLSRDQQAQVEVLAEEHLLALWKRASDARVAAKKGNPLTGDAREYFGRLQKEFDDRGLMILTEDQRKAFENLRGEPFDQKLLDPVSARAGQK